MQMQHNNLWSRNNLSKSIWIFDIGTEIIVKKRQKEKRKKTHSEKLDCKLIRQFWIVYVYMWMCDDDSLLSMLRPSNILEAQE